MIRACFASTSGGWEWAIIRKPTVSRPRFRASPKCCTAMSASVQWVAIRQIDAPLSRATRMSSFTPTPGNIRKAILASRAVSAATVISSCSGVLLKPYVNDEPPRPSPWVTSMTGTPASSRAATIERTSSAVNWWRLWWDPSRRDVSVILTRILHPQCDLFTDAHRGGGHDVQVSGVRREEVARPFDFDEHGHPCGTGLVGTIKLRIVQQSVTGNVLGDGRDHRRHRPGDLVRVGIVRDRADDGVPHD